MQNNPYQAPEADLQATEDDEVCEKMKYFSLSQRIGRLRYLAYVFGIYLLFAVLAGLGAALGMEQPENQGFMLIPTLIGYGLLFFYAIVFQVRRLHDLDQSGWWAALSLVPLVNIALGIYLLFFRGSPQRNRFGPRPRPNTLGVKIAGFAAPVLIVAGILAAVAIPAYQDYVTRAQQAQGLE